MSQQKNDLALEHGQWGKISLGFCVIGEPPMRKVLTPTEPKRLTLTRKTMDDMTKTFLLLNCTSKVVYVTVAFILKDYDYGYCREHLQTHLDTIG